MAVGPHLTPHERGLAMARRVYETAARSMRPDIVTQAADPAIDHDPAARVHRAVITALLARHHLDPRDTRYLHPGRTALILLDDCGVTDPVALAAGALLETWHPDLAVSLDGLDTDVAALLARVPRPDLPPNAAESDARGHQEGTSAETPHDDPDYDHLREALVSADDDARLIALVERLDHARHVHLYPQPEQQPLRDSVRAAYLPVAEWLGGMIGARYRRLATAWKGRRTS